MLDASSTSEDAGNPDEQQSLPVTRRSMLTYAASAPVVTAAAGLALRRRRRRRFRFR